jgi:putative addiction module killer protein
VTNWNINYCDSVESWLDALDHAQYKSVSKELRLIELWGNNLGLPHSKSLGKGLFELRERRFGLRMYYCFYERKAILLLHAGNKSRQKKDIKLARDLFSQLKTR